MPFTQTKSESSVFLADILGPFQTLSTLVILIEKQKNQFFYS
jgi:hypothetical protein